MLLLPAVSLWLKWHGPSICYRSQSAPQTHIGSRIWDLVVGHGSNFCRFPSESEDVCRTYSLGTRCAVSSPEDVFVDNGAALRHHLQPAASKKDQPSPLGPEYGLGVESHSALSGLDWPFSPTRGTLDAPSTLRPNVSTQMWLAAA
ncbi:hypothetical protein PG997_014355 [Apiospora hydei]|uniref:Uncharacterized protein n=1 Tax=Apiospora hydei TaxID=1337664 RepID=A0ABR1UTJ5_9PEZI